MKTSPVRLNRLETRFLLNFALEENNKIVHPRFVEGPLHQTNLNNLAQKFPQRPQQIRKYAKIMTTLVRKLMKTDREFYTKIQRRFNT